MAIDTYTVFIVIWGIVIFLILLCGLHNCFCKESSTFCKESSLENSTRNNSLSDNNRVQTEENSHSSTAGGYPEGSYQRFERTEDL